MTPQQIFAIVNKLVNLSQSQVRLYKEISSYLENTGIIDAETEIVANHANYLDPQHADYNAEYAETFGHLTLAELNAVISTFSALQAFFQADSNVHLRVLLNSLIQPV